MKLLNKIKDLFGKKQDLSPNKKKLANDKEIQNFFDKNSGWEKESLTYFLDKTKSRKGTITAYASFSREATQEEVEKESNRKLICEIELKEPKTLDKIWDQALTEIQEHGELQEYVAQRGFKEPEDFFN